MDEKCSYFSYVYSSEQCSLLGGDIVSRIREGVYSGARNCVTGTHSSSVPSDIKKCSSIAADNHDSKLVINVILTKCSYPCHS